MVESQTPRGFGLSWRLTCSSRSDCDAGIIRKKKADFRETRIFVDPDGEFTLEELLAEVSIGRNDEVGAR